MSSVRSIVRPGRTGVKGDNEVLLILETIDITMKGKDMLDWIDIATDEWSPSDAFSFNYISLEPFTSRLDGSRSYQAVVFGPN